MIKNEKLRDEIALIKYSEDREIASIITTATIFVTAFIAVIIYSAQSENRTVYWVGMILALLFALNTILKQIKPATNKINAEHQMIRERYEKMGINVKEIDEELIRLTQKK